MKLAYEKPMMIAEEFTPNTSVAYCTNTYDTTSWEPQTVKCVISSSDKIFGADNCAKLSGYTVVDAGTLTYVEGEGYFFIWEKSDDHDDFGGWPWTLSGKSGLKTILKAAGISTSNWQNYHAGPVKFTTTTVNKQNWSL